MPATDPVITIERFNETHIEGITALYNDPAVARQVLQMPFQSTEVWHGRGGRVARPGRWLPAARGGARPCRQLDERAAGRTVGVCG